MRGRDLIAGIAGSVAAWPLAARAQQEAKPVIGFLRSTPAAPFANLTSSFLAGLNEAGFVDGKNVAITYRFANNERDRLQVYAADLVSRRVNVIVCNGDAAVAAKEATTEIPIVFATGEDPVRQGLVTNLARPSGNLTGVTFLGGGELGAKRIELLRDLLPNVVTIGILMDPNYSGAENELSDAQTAARALGRKVICKSS
jgi:putative ABC transport system substrate-binding protein